jgi:fluoride ion exporter CrcB/FEX
MWKDVAFVAAAAALGEYASRKWGGKIEQKALEMKIPPAVAHAAVVGSFAAGAFFAFKAIL